MSGKNMILEVLEDNGIPELFVEEGHTTLEMEDLISCPKNPENPKEQQIPLMSISEWISYLKQLEDVIAITGENSGFSASRGAGKELRISLSLKLKGALKAPKKDHAFERVFFPIQETLLKILSQRLSYATYLAINPQAERATSDIKDDSSESTGTDDLDLETEFATQATL